MASFYAELRVAGHVYVLRRCDFSFTLAADNRGRVIEKVRHSLIDAELDVPDNSFLEAWAAAVYKPRPGHITFLPPRPPFGP